MTHQETTRSSDEKAASPAPHNLAAEEALLGAALFSSEALEVLAKKVAPEDFYRPAHRQIARALVSAFEAEQAADIVTIGDALARSGHLDTVGGPAYLVSLVANTPATSNAVRYAEIIHDDATLRRLQQASAAVFDLVAKRPDDVHGAVERAQAAFADVASQNGARTYSNLHIPDMAALVAGEVVRQEMSILSRSDGQCLFYAGKMHTLQGQPGSGKSWIALQACVDVLKMGGSVIYMDHEDTDRDVVDRLKALGADLDAVRQRLQYVQPMLGMNSADRVTLGEMLKDLTPDLVVIDGVGESIAMDGYSENDNTEVIRWANNYPRFIARTGASVVMIDHIAKDEDGKKNESPYARGASAKLAIPDGCSYKIQTISPFSRHRPGSAKMVVGKDRLGTFASKEIAAMVRFEPSGAGEIMRLGIDPNTEQTEGDNWKPTRIMEKLSIEVERAPNPLTSRALLDIASATTKTALVKDALARLQAENYLATFRLGSTTFLRLIKPYRSGDKSLPPETEQTSLATEWQSRQDDLAKRRAQKQKERGDDGDPGPTEPTD